MNTLREAINEYLLLRRELGFKLANAQHWLLDFASFMEDQGALFITTEWAVRWALRPKHSQPSYWALRLMAVRRFALYRSATDPRTEVPPVGFLPVHPRRAKPYLYTEKDVERLMKAAEMLRPRGGLRGSTYSCLIGLLAVTGLRIGEALQLRLDDVDLQDGVLAIRKTKFGKSRLVPLHPSTQHVLLQYAQRRDAHHGRATITQFFVSERGKPLRALAVHRAFRILCHKTGLHASERCDEPQLHHFRHRFATTTLLRWYRSTDDVERQLPLLSTFLGHACISSTYWYLSAHPELMGQAVRRLEHRWEKYS